MVSGEGSSIVGEAHIHIFVFCIINFFWNRLFLRCSQHEYMNPPLIELPTPLTLVRSWLEDFDNFIVLSLPLPIWTNYDDFEHHEIFLFYIVPSSWLASKTQYWGFQDIKSESCDSFARTSPCLTDGIFFPHSASRLLFTSKIVYGKLSRGEKLVWYGRELDQKFAKIVNYQMLVILTQIPKQNHFTKHPENHLM